MTDANEAVQRFFRLWNERDMEEAERLFPADFRAVPIAYEAVWEGHGPVWEGQGPEAMKHHVLTWMLGMPDLRMNEVRRLGQGPWIVSHWEMVGTHKGVLYGVAATGLRLCVTGITWFEVAEGRIVQLRTCFDALGFLQQLGVLPDAASILSNIANSSVP